VRRREFITLVGGAAAAWPMVARSQQVGKVPRIGFLGLASPSTFAARFEGLRQGLRDFGYVEGATIAIEYRWAEGHYERLPELARELVRSNVELILTHATPGGLAAKQATSTIPIVVALSGDPVATGIVTNLARPGGNITGQSFFNPELRSKRIELLKDVKPSLIQVAVILSADNPATKPEFQAMETTAQALKVKLQPFHLRRPSEFVGAFEAMEQAHAEAIEIGDDPVSNSNLGTIAALAIRGKLLSVGPIEYVQAGGLLGYGVDVAATYRHAAVYVDKILRGAKAGDIPIEQASKFKFAVNLKTASALGVKISPDVLSLADEVVE
jgi:putative ABC transport system substrate-binding protein